MSRAQKAMAFVVGFILTSVILGVGVLIGEAWGSSYEKHQQVATYNDGWTDGQQDLMQRQWDARYPGKECKR